MEVKPDRFIDGKCWRGSVASITLSMIFVPRLLLFFMDWGMGMFTDLLPLKSQMFTGLKQKSYLLNVSFASWWILKFTMTWKSAWHQLLRLESVVGHYFWIRGYFPIFNKPACQNMLKRKCTKCRCYRILSRFQKFRGTFPGWYLSSEVTKNFCW